MFDTSKQVLLRNLVFTPLPDIGHSFFLYLITQSLVLQILNVNIVHWTRMIIFYEGTFVQIKGFQRSFILAENFKIIPIFIIHFETLYNGELHSTIIKPSNKYWHLILCLANSLTFPIPCDLDQIE